MNEDGIRKFYNRLDRSFFIDNEYKKSAGVDAPLPIGFGQTISQPSLVLQMTLWLEPDENCRVLEIGTGSGYQTALLAQFSKEVYTVERIKKLTVKAQQRLHKLGFNNVDYKIGDGSEGWNQYAPFDRIITTAAAGSIPEKLLEQLSPGGVAVMPVGPRLVQDLMKFTKDEDGKVKATLLEKVRFVELMGQYGWS